MWSEFINIFNNLLSNFEYGFSYVICDKSGASKNKHRAVLDL